MPVPYQKTKQEWIKCSKCGNKIKDGITHKRKYCGKCCDHPKGSKGSKRKHGAIVPCPRCGKGMFDGLYHKKECCYLCRKKMDDENKPRKGRLGSCIVCNKKILAGKTKRRLYCPICNPYKKNEIEHHRKLIPCPKCGGMMLASKNGKKRMCSTCQAKYKIGKYAPPYWKNLYSKFKEVNALQKEQNKKEDLRKFGIIAEKFGERTFTSRDVFRLQIETRGGLLKRMVANRIIIKIGNDTKRRFNYKISKSSVT